MERSKLKLLEPTVLLTVQACLPARGAPYAHPVLPACFREPRVGKAPGRSPGEELNLNQGGRKKTWLCWVVQPSGSSLPYLPFPLASPNGRSFQSRNWRTCKESQNPYSSPTWVCGWVLAGRTGTPRDGEAGTAQPPSTFLPLKQAQRR